MAASFTTVLVDIAKLRDYCLSDSHLRGRHKARVFRSRLGLTANDAGLLQAALLDAADNWKHDFQPTSNDAYGQRYILDLPMSTPKGAAIIRSSWIVLTGETTIRLTSCYVL